MREQYSTRLEPRLLARFLDILGPYPWGTLLLVGGEHLAVVTRPNAEARDNPLVRLIEVENGHARAHVEELALREVAGHGERLEIVDPAVIGINLTAALHGTAANGYSDPPDG
jgi:hypothetical protein